MWHRKAEVTYKQTNGTLSYSREFGATDSFSSTGGSFSSVCVSALGLGAGGPANKASSHQESRNMPLDAQQAYVRLFPFSCFFFFSHPGH